MFHDVDWHVADNAEVPHASVSVDDETVAVFYPNISELVPGAAPELYAELAEGFAAQLRTDLAQRKEPLPMTTLSRNHVSIATLTGGTAITEAEAVRVAWALRYAFTFAPDPKPGDARLFARVIAALEGRALDESLRQHPHPGLVEAPQAPYDAEA